MHCHAAATIHVVLLAAIPIMHCYLGCQASSASLTCCSYPIHLTCRVDSICADWRFERIIPCHFNAPVRTTPDEFQRAFTFAYDAASRTLAPPEKPSGLGGLLGGLFGGKTGAGEAPYQLPEADLKTMNNINNMLLRLGAVYADAESRQ